VPSRLDALLADLHDDAREHTAVEETPFKRDPISELIHLDPRKREAIIQTKPRVPSLDDPDDDTPLPPPRRDSDSEASRAIGHGTDAPPMPRSSTRDESAAMDALLGLDEPVRRVASAADQAALAAAKLEEAAKRAEAAAARVEVKAPDGEAAAKQAARRAAAKPIVVEDIPQFDVPPPRLKSRMFGVVLMLVMIGCGVAFYAIYRSQRQATAGGQARQAELEKEAAEKSRLANAALADAGAIVVTSTPSQAGVWLRLGRTPLNTMQLSASSTHELAFLLDGHELGEVQVVAGNWSGEGDKQKGLVNVTLKKLEPSAATPPKGPKKPPPATALPLQPTAIHATTTAKGRGSISVQSSPADAEAFLYVGLTGSMRFSDLTAGRDYELVVVKDGYKPRHITIKADDWRDGGDPNIPIDSAKKKSQLERSVELEPLPDPKKAR
jgi:hypothetical protein